MLQKLENIPQTLCAGKFLGNEDNFNLKTTHECLRKSIFRVGFKRLKR